MSRPVPRRRPADRRRLRDPISRWRRLRSAIALVAMALVLGVLLAGILAAAIGAIVIALQHALKG